MKNDDHRRRANARPILGARLVGKCDSALKVKAARARDYGLGEGDLVRLATDWVVDALLEGRLVVMNGKLVPAALAPTPHPLQPAAAPTPTGTEG